jgi:hypothetical protein
MVDQWIPEIARCCENSRENDGDQDYRLQKPWSIAPGVDFLLIQPTATMRFPIIALMALPFAVGRRPFLQQTSNNTWILGNNIWNITQGPIYGTKLYYQGKDAIGSAAGHYVGAGMNSIFSPPRL